jgi:hypothetical protein
VSEPGAPQRFGNWKLIGAGDPSGKRLICRCLTCGEVKTVSAEALVVSGHVVCVNCSPARNLSDRSERTSFASEFANAETRGAKGKRYGKS